MKSYKLLWALPLALVLAGGAQARDVYWSVNAGSPGVSVGVGSVPGMYAPPPPPPPMYVPAPVYVPVPPPVVYERSPRSHMYVQPSPPPPPPMYVPAPPPPVYGRLPRSHMYVQPSPPPPPPMYVPAPVYISPYGARR